jgi:hypothetical protein
MLAEPLLNSAFYNAFSTCRAYLGGFPPMSKGLDPPMSKALDPPNFKP